MKKFKIIIGILIFFIGFTFSAVEVKAETLENNVTNQMESIDFESIQNELDSSLSNSSKKFLGYSFKEIVTSVLNGDFKIGYDNLFTAVFNLFFDGILDNLGFFLVISAVCLFSSIIGGIKSESLKSGVDEIIYFVSYICVVTLVTGTLFALIGDVKEIVTSISRQASLIMPAILSLMIASSNTVAVGMFKPAVAFLTTGSVQIISVILLPLISVVFIFEIVGHLSNNVSLNSYVNLFKSVIKWIIGIMVSLFTIFLTIQGLTTSTFDGLSYKALKSAVSSSIPIIGGFLGGSFDIVIASSTIIKNALGSGMLILLLAQVLPTLIKIIGFSILLKLTCAVCEPIADGKVIKLMQGLSGAVNYLIAVLAFVSFIYIITILMMICASSSIF